MFRQPLSTTTNFDDMKEQYHHYHHHHHYHYHYAPMTVNMSQPLSNHCQQQCYEKSEPSNSLVFEPTMTIIDHQVPLKYKENIYRNSTLKLRRCVALFLHLIGKN